MCVCVYKREHDCICMCKLVCLCVLVNVLVQSARMHVRMHAIVRAQVGYRFVRLADTPLFCLQPEQQLNIVLAPLPSGLIRVRLFKKPTVGHALNSMCGPLACAILCVYLHALYS